MSTKVSLYATLTNLYFKKAWQVGADTLALQPRIPRSFGSIQVDFDILHRCIQKLTTRRLPSCLWSTLIDLGQLGIPASELRRTGTLKGRENREREV